MGIATKEVRELAVKAYLSGKGTLETVSRMFECHTSTLKRWLREYKEENRLEPRRRGHMAAAFSPQEREQLAAFLEEHPDVTLEQVREQFEKTCSLVTVHNTIRALGFSYKKNRYARLSKSGRM
ncbi:helix-turn-helix domain-containing protein [Megalodesulfovibrio gigas]|uniref:helix-turn-helix domain-containing protein n=1 Tax=Megalodesulfovibrio gigas TaxID=879 RepID=UPI0009DB938D